MDEKRHMGFTRLIILRLSLSPSLLVGAMVWFLSPWIGNAQTTLLFTDAPATNQTMTGAVGFSGWAIDSAATIAGVSFTIDNTNYTMAQYGFSRNDVCNAVGQWPGCPNVGWWAFVDTSQLPNGPHVLAVTAATMDARRTTINVQFSSSNGAAAVYEIVNKLSDKVLDVTGASSNNGTIIQQWDFNGGGQQKWLLVPVDSQYYKIVNQLTGKVLDITGVSTSDGAIIQEYDYLGGDNQKWQLVPTGGGYFAITSKLDGKVLDDTGVATTDGSYIQQWGFLGGDNQQWLLAPDGSIPIVEGSTQSSAAETSDGSVSGLSILSIAGGTTTTYSQTELDYAASLYYDAYTAGYLFDNGATVASGGSANTGTAPASGELSTSSLPWHDYQAETDHYVVAFLASSYGYYDPFGYSYAPDTDGSGDVVFDSTGVSVYVAAEYIYLGSTVVDQIYVPHDVGGAIPIVDDSVYGYFEQQAAQSSPDLGTSLPPLDGWNSAIRAILPALFLAESAYELANGGINPYPLPMALQLISDAYVDTNPPVERDRLYMVRDIDGMPWKLKYPLSIDENLVFVAGNQQIMPQPNPTGWTTDNGELKNGSSVFAELLDTHSTKQLYSNSYVYFWQQYYATGFNAPNLSLPGIPALGPVANAIPLMILDPNPPISPTGCAWFGTQSFLLSSGKVGVNGDAGPGPVCPW